MLENLCSVIFNEKTYLLYSCLIFPYERPSIDLLLLTILHNELLPCAIVEATIPCQEDYSTGTQALAYFFHAWVFIGGTMVIHRRNAHARDAVLIWTSF